MAKLTTRQADQFLYDLAKPIIVNLSSDLGYEVFVYYPGLDAPRAKKNKTQVYIEMIRTNLKPEPFGIESDSGFLAGLELRTMIHATEKVTDFENCAKFANTFVDTFSRRRCGNDLVIMDSYWEDTEFREGRRIFTIITNCEYER